MTAAYAPQTLHDLFDKITVPGKVLSGILGDDRHFAEGGYHVPRHWCKSTDYSVQLPVDRQGDEFAARAIDLSFHDIENHFLVSRRMLTAFQNHDPRLWPVREYFGSVDGKRVIGWDRHDPTKLTDDTPSTSDSSHDWHGHTSIYTGYVLDPRWVKGLADVMNGVPLPHPPAPAGGTLHMAWPAWMLPGHVFGDINGPDWCHGGAIPSERDEVTAIQRALQRVGKAPNVPGWADGRFEQPTIGATKAFQRSRGLLADGLVGKATWRALFTY